MNRSGSDRAQLRPRRLVHRGIVEASGFIVDPRLLGEREARARILSRWTAGTRVFRIDEGYLLLPPKSERIAVDRAPGTPLVRAGGNGPLSAAPLDKDELEATHAPRDAVIVVRGGRAEVTEADSEDAIDPAQWIDDRAFTLAEVKPLGELPPPPQVVAEQITVDLRAALGAKLPPPPEELEEIKRALRRVGVGTEGEGEAPQQAKNVRRSTWRAFARAMLGRMAARAAEMLSALTRLNRKAAARKNTKGGTTRIPALVAAPEPPREADDGLLARLRDRLHALAVQLLRATRLANVVGRRQAEYIARMMEMFEKGDLGDALRHAIPLNDVPSEKPPLPALSVPTPRDALTISSAKSSSGRSSFAVGADLFSDLRSMYRRAFERLDREKRYEEAAFVLAELLQSSEEAVMYLEKHGFKDLAAELAESRKLAPGLIVRQWFVAGRVERAVQIARRTGAFADAILRLEKSSKEQADALRSIFADTLADAGNYAAAVDAIWPVERARHLARPWIQQAIAAGGPAAARMLVKSVLLFPDSFAEVLARATELLEDEAYETLHARIALAGALVQAQPTAETRVLARPCVRAMLRDAGTWSESVSRGDFDRLVKHTGDRALATDLPQLPSKTAAIDLHHREHPKAFKIARGDTGTLAISDVALLPSGRILAALGEAGTRLFTRDGRTAAHFDLPARHLVVSDSGDRVIALAPRGPVMSLSRIDLVRTKATPWCELALSSNAPSFDGSLWFVAVKSLHHPGEELLALDATSSKVEALWRLGGVRVLKLERSTSSMSALCSKENNALECWTHELPSLTLRRRVPIPLLSPTEHKLLGAAALSADGMVAVTGTAVPAFEQSMDRTSRSGPVAVDPEPTLEFRPYLLFTREGWVETSYVADLDPATQFFAPAVSNEWFVLPFAGSEGCSTCVIDVKTGQTCARIDLEGASTCTARLQENVLIVADDRGRIVIFEHKQGRVLASLRV